MPKTLRYVTEPAPNNLVRCSPTCPHEIVIGQVAVGSTACKYCDFHVSDNGNDEVVCSFGDGLKEGGHAAL